MLRPWPSRKSFSETVRYAVDTGIAPPRSRNTPLRSIRRFVVVLVAAAGTAGLGFLALQAKSRAISGPAAFVPSPGPAGHHAPKRPSSRIVVQAAKAGGANGAVGTAPRVGEISGLIRKEVPPLITAAAAGSEPIQFAALPPASNTVPAGPSLDPYSSRIAEPAHSTSARTATVDDSQRTEERAWTQAVAARTGKTRAVRLLRLARAATESGPGTSPRPATSALPGKGRPVVAPPRARQSTPVAAWAASRQVGPQAFASAPHRPPGFAAPRTRVTVCLYFVLCL